jgi:hypothetical protein
MIYVESRQTLVHLAKGISQERDALKSAVYRMVDYEKFGDHGFDLPLQAAMIPL